MVSLKIFLLFFLFSCAYSKDEPLLLPCAAEDLECLKVSTNIFMEKTAAGIPDYDIRPIDPLFINLVSVQSDKNEILHFKNVTITGFKNLDLYNFKLNRMAKSVWLPTKEDLKIFATLAVEFTDVSKIFTGPYAAKASTIGTARYNYELKKDDKDVVHFELGPATLSCESTAEPQITLGKELEYALRNDPDAQKTRNRYYANEAEKRKAAVCRVIDEALVTIVHNIRAAAKVLPKEAFFTNV